MLGRRLKYRRQFNPCCGATPLEKTKEARILEEYCRLLEEKMASSPIEYGEKSYLLEQYEESLCEKFRLQAEIKVEAED